MMAIRDFLVAGLVCSLLAGCAKQVSVELVTAKAFQAAAEKCLISVRDQGEKFEASPDCRVAEAKIEAFVSARNLRETTPIEAQLPIESGYRMVWAARAKSVANDPSLKLWQNNAQNQ
jgi:hypothetical protein